MFKGLAANIFVPGNLAKDMRLGEGEGPLHKAAAYRQHARECQALSRHAQNEDQRLQLLAMAETWEALATEREAAVPAH